MGIWRKFRQGTKTSSPSAPGRRGPTTEELRKDYQRMVNELQKMDIMAQEAIESKKSESKKQAEAKKEEVRRSAINQGFCFVDFSLMHYIGINDELEAELIKKIAQKSCPKNHPNLRVSFKEHIGQRKENCKFKLEFSGASTVFVDIEFGGKNPNVLPCNLILFLVENGKLDQAISDACKANMASKTITIEGYAGDERCFEIYESHVTDNDKSESAVSEKEDLFPIKKETKIKNQSATFNPFADLKKRMQIG